MNEVITNIFNSDVAKFLWPYFPKIIFYSIVLLGAYLVQSIITSYIKKIDNEYGNKYGVQFNPAIVKIVIYGITAFVIFINLPGISKEEINIISLVFGGIVAFSSSTLIANTMAGVMILIMRPYKIGDIVRLDDHFGEVAEIKLIYTLIENELRELITIPNSKIINDKIVNYSKDKHLISSTVNIEYKTDRYTVEKHLIKAAKTLNLKNPFVLIKKLDNYHIEYEVRGILENVGEIITIHSDLNKAIVDEFDKAKIQIMTPERITLLITKKEAEFPNTKIKSMNKKHVEKEAQNQEKIMFGRAEQIKKEIQKPKN